MLTGDARTLDRLLDPTLRRRVALLLTLPPYGASVHGIVTAHRGQRSPHTRQLLLDRPRQPRPRRPRTRPTSPTTMLTRIKEQRDIDYLIVHKVDRLARNRADDVTINLALKTAGAQLVSVTENIDETPSGKLLHGVMASMAEFYSANLANEIIQGTTQKARAGGSPHKAPIGYLNVRQHIDDRAVRTIAIDPDRAPLITYAFQAHATGTYSLHQLLDELTDLGLTNRAADSRPERPPCTYPNSPPCCATPTTSASSPTKHPLPRPTRTARHPRAVRTSPSHA